MPSSPALRKVQCQRLSLSWIRDGFCSRCGLVKEQPERKTCKTCRYETRLNKIHRGEIKAFR